MAEKQPGFTPRDEWLEEQAASDIQPTGNFQERQDALAEGEQAEKGENYDA